MDTMRSMLKFLFLCLLPICFAQTKAYCQVNHTGNYKRNFLRKKFKLGNTDVVRIKVFSEKDFFHKHKNRRVVFELQNDLLISTSIVLLPNNDYCIDGNGHKVSETGYAPRNFSEPIKAEFWTVDSVNKVAKFRLTSPFGKKYDNGSVRVHYEAWYIRFTGKLMSLSDSTLVCACDNKCLRDKRFLKYTPQPYLFIESNVSKKKQKCLFSVGANTSILLENTRFEDISSLCIKNKGVLRVTNCIFKNINEGILSYGELFVDNSSFHNLTSNSIKTVRGSYLDVVNCKFSEVGLYGTNIACVSSSGDAYIANNKFIDYNYSAIKLGIRNLREKQYLPMSYVENNILIWTKPWMKKMKIYGLNDSGAIYIATNNKSCTIRNNTILNFGGHGANRGIFCDDGAYNLSIYGNVIKGIENSYDIDSRDCSKRTYLVTPEGLYANTNNNISNNVCSGRVRLVGSSQKKMNNCVFENNIIVSKYPKKNNIVMNIKDKEAAILYDSKAVIYDDGRVKLSAAPKNFRIVAPHIKKK